MLPIFCESLPPDASTTDYSVMEGNPAAKRISSQPAQTSHILSCIGGLDNREELYMETMGGVLL